MNPRVDPYEPTERPEPFVGWRIWKVYMSYPLELHSWAVDYNWVPGKNTAICLGPSKRCPFSPGLHCQCGLWALFNPFHAIARGVKGYDPAFIVLGLVLGWGSVAVHGVEGFRAERASIKVLFTEDLHIFRNAPSPRRLFDTMFGRVKWRGYPTTPSERIDIIRGTGDRYGVPTTSLKQALNSGLLAEMNAPQRDEVAAICRQAEYSS